MRYLFVTLDGGGNLYPELALATRLVKRGHAVRFLGHRSQRGAVERAGHPFRAYERAPDYDATWSATSPFKDWADDPAIVFAAMCDLLWFGAADRFAADVAAEIVREPTDALAVDYFAFGGMMAAERAGLPTAALWHTTFGEWDGWNAGRPALNAARAGVGLPPLDTVFEQYRRMDRVLVLTSAAFDLALAQAGLPVNVVHAGPQLAEAPEDGTTADAPGEPPLVLVSLSTSYQAQEGVLRRVVAALGMLPIRALVTTGPAVAFDGEIPDNVAVRAWVSHAEVLPRAALVITHAGMGTVMATLAHGVPLLCMPMGRDQHGNAARVAHLGAGRVLAAEADVPEIAAAVRDTLADPALRACARRVADVMRAEIAADRAVREMEALASGTARRAANGAVVHAGMGD
jgi:UDP:flavonoid glycosyltransferase YjiC (YdhE family)